MAEPVTLESLKDKFKTAPKPKDVSLNARYLMVHLLYNVFGQKVPRNLKKGKLPSTDADSLDQMDHPFCSRLKRWRSVSRSISSLQSAARLVRKATDFNPDAPEGEERAPMVFTCVGYDNIERAFTQPGVSIPINLDKKGRHAFVTPPATRQLASAIHSNPDCLAHEDPALNALLKQLAVPPQTDLGKNLDDLIELEA